MRAISPGLQAGELREPNCHPGLAAPHNVTHPGGMVAIQALPPLRGWVCINGTLTGGVAALNPRLMAATPPGYEYAYPEATGGVAALNPRLMAMTPPGYEYTYHFVIEGNGNGK